LEDGHKGFAESGNEIKDPSIRTFSLEESRVRAQFANELEDHLHRLGVKNIEETGTAAGAFHRAWADLKVKLGGGDHTLLVTAEQGEDEAKEAYGMALKQHLPNEIEVALKMQLQHVIQAHNKVRVWRDTKKKD
jgi:uncharacterized protein (TIGR02284 family)